MFERVRAGQPLKFSARQINGWNESAEAYKNGDRKDGDQDGVSFANPLVVKVTNKTGEFLNTFSVVSLGGPVNLGDDDERNQGSVFDFGIWFDGNKPTGDDNETICILLNAANKDEVVDAMIVGPVCCTVDIQDTSHRFAVPVSGDTKKLESSETGTVKILSPRTETGEAFCYVLLGVSTPGESSTNYAGVVMETFGPGEDGRVAIYGKNYPTEDKDGNPIEPVYDIITCDELAGAQNEHPEKLVKGTVLTDIRGPFTRKKSPPPEDENESETEQYYVAVNTEGVYSGILLSEVTGPDAESTIQIADSEDDLTTMTIHSYYLGEYQTIEAETGVMVARQRTESGLRLVIVKSRSVITDTEPE